VESLQANKESSASDLVVFCDGPRSKTDVSAVEAVRTLASGIRGFRSVQVRAHEHNLGLSRSIIEGVTSMLADSDRIIVVEDDLVLSPHFLAFMNAGLDRYADEPRIASIHGYVYPVTVELPETFFMRGADCWGWSTWRRAWPVLDRDARRLLDKLRASGLCDAFDLGGSYPFSKMLADKAEGRNDSWAIRWHASVFLENMLTLYPGRSLVQNIGHDSSGTHCGTTELYDVHASADPIRVDDIEIVASEPGRRAFELYFRSAHVRVRRSWWRAFRDRFSRSSR
jgi:hypothetical protein